MADLTYKYKTKSDGSRTLMICSNSNPDASTYPEYAPIDGTCENWSVVSNDVVQVLCAECTNRMAHNYKGEHRATININEEIN